MNPTAQDEITAYVEGVRQALVDLPEVTRQELLEDLPEHLAEVQAEGHGTLIERLGTPAAYAAELRATAGFADGLPDLPPSKSVPFSEVRDKTAALLRRADVRVGPVIGYPKASEFLRLLRPAWWVLRGYLAAMAIAYLFDRSGSSRGLLPRIGGSDLFALVLLAGCVVLSILLGRRAPVLSPWPKYALWSGTAFLAIFALAGFATVDGTVREPGYRDAGSYDSNPYSNVGDVFVYDSSGRLVVGARLFDQEGTPIQLGSPWCTNPDTGESAHSRTMGYPYCPENAPFASPSAAERDPAPTSPASSSGPAPTSPVHSGRPAPSPAPSSPLPSLPVLEPTP